MIDFTGLKNDMQDTAVESYFEALAQAVEQRMNNYTHGELAQWQQLISNLPTISPSEIDLQTKVQVGTKKELQNSLNPMQCQEFIDQLKKTPPMAQRSISPIRNSP